MLGYGSEVSQSQIDAEVEAEVEQDTLENDELYDISLTRAVNTINAILASTFNDDDTDSIW